jgi:Leucine-rich repeat (LRR) protein
MAFRANHTQELFKNGTNLRKLSMNFCTVPFNHRRPFDRDPLDGLHLLSNLECLSLSDLKYEDDPEPFSSTPNLSISAREIECFLEATAGRLRSLDLSYNKFLPTEPNLQAATNLIELHIAGQEFCNPAVFKTFLESVGPNLRCLSLGGSNLPEFTICELVGLLPHLEKLDLRKKSLSHTTVRYIGKCCPELQMLNLRLCGGNIQPESFFDDKRCVFLSLRELDIVGCSTVLTGEAEIMWQWQPWIADLPTLEILWISWNLEQLSYVRSTYPFFNRVQVLLAHQA